LEYACLLGKAFQVTTPHTDLHLTLLPGNTYVKSPKALFYSCLC